MVALVLFDGGLGLVVELGHLLVQIGCKAVDSQDTAVDRSRVVAGNFAVLDDRRP